MRRMIRTFQNKVSFGHRRRACFVKLLVEGDDRLYTIRVHDVARLHKMTEKVCSKLIPKLIFATLSFSRR